MLRMSVPKFGLKRAYCESTYKYQLNLVDLVIH